MNAAERIFFYRPAPYSLLSSASLCFLIARFAEQCEHIFLIALYARLVERIDAQKVSTDAAGKFEEIEELS